MRVWYFLFGCALAVSTCRDPTVSSCAKCLALGPTCSWCSEPPKTKDFTANRIRCGTWKELVDDKCHTNHIKSVEASIDTHILGDHSPLQPLLAKGILRYGARKNHTLEFTRPQFFAVDMFYVMDLSHSMSDDLKNLKTLARELVDVMKNVTNNMFRIGHGSFVDRPVTPFINSNKEYFENPCSLIPEVCQSPFTYKTNSKLTKDYEKWRSILQNDSYSNNVDLPEAGLDGIIQSIQCKKLVDWQKGTFKILMYSSDAPPHVAGDGILGGLIEPNDGACYMDQEHPERPYSKESVFDYPSIGRVLEVIKAEEISVILAITEDVLPFYRNLRNEIEKVGKAEIGILSKDSKNVVDLVREQYGKLAQHASLKTENIPEELKVRIFTERENGAIIENSSCDGVKANDKVKFIIEIEMPQDISLEKCIELQATLDTDKPRFKVYGMSNTGAELELKLACDCSCSSSEPPNLKLPESLAKYGETFECLNDAEYKCGVCNCPSGYSGIMCQCQNQPGDRKCFNPENPTRACSGRGICDCDGTCICNYEENRNISGAYCEHDTNLCPKGIGGLSCSGKGICNKYYRCDCNEGWGGAACECSKSTNHCRVNNDDDLCYGNGECKCNTCECDILDGGLYSADDMCKDLKTSCTDHELCARCTYNATISLGIMHHPDCETCIGNYHDMYAEDEVLKLKDYESHLVDFTSRTVDACKARIWTEDKKCILDFFVNSKKGPDQKNFDGKFMINIQVDPNLRCQEEI